MLLMVRSSVIKCADKSCHVFIRHIQFMGCTYIALSEMGSIFQVVFLLYLYTNYNVDLVAIYLVLNFNLYKSLRTENDVKYM